MAIYIEDEKTGVIESFYTSKKIEKAVRTLLSNDKEIMFSETDSGYKVKIIEKK